MITTSNRIIFGLGLGVAFLLGAVGAYWLVGFRPHLWGVSGYGLAKSLGIASSLVLLSWCAVAPRTLNGSVRTALYIVTIGWFGIVAGLTASPTPKRDMSWQLQSAFEPDVDSEIYELTLERYSLPKEALEIVGSTVIVYLAKATENRFFAIASGSLGTVDLDNVPEQARRGKVALLQLSIGEGLDEVDWIDLTSVAPAIRQVRDLQAIDSNTILVSNASLVDNCLTLQLWELKLELAPLQVTNSRMLFESYPKICGGRRFLIAAGGRILVEDDGTILLAVGDFRLGPSFVTEEEGYTGRPDEMIPPNSYGMVLRINRDGNATPYTTGHRNIQGLARDPRSGRIWSSEHGPRGGDELNMLVEGDDYGWPEVTYGAPYFSKLPAGDWKSGRWASYHEGFEQPAMAWLPSIAPSQIVVYTGAEFPLWEGDVLLSTLRDESIRRLRTVSGRVVLDERIAIGSRIRDLVLRADGRLLLSFDGGELAELRLKTNDRPPRE